MSTARSSSTGTSGGGWTPTFHSITASASSSSRRPAQGARFNSERRYGQRHPARPRAPTWSSRTSRPRETSSSPVAPMSARCSTPGPRALNSNRTAVIASAAARLALPPTAVSRRSAIRTATAGSCKRSRPGCPAGSMPLKRRSHPGLTWRAPFGGRRTPMPSTSSAPARPTRIGPIGMPHTSWRSRPARICPREAGAAYSAAPASLTRLGVPNGLVGKEEDVVLDDLGVEKAHGLLGTRWAEEAFARSEHDREDLQPELVDQVVLDQRVYQLKAGGDEDVPG